MFDQHSDLKQKAEVRKESAKEKQLKEEAQLLESVTGGSALMGVSELAKGIAYTEAIETGWKPPTYVREAPPERHDRIRKKLHILVEGRQVRISFVDYYLRLTADAFPRFWKFPYYFGCDIYISLPVRYHLLAKRSKK